MLRAAFSILILLIAFLVSCGPSEAEQAETRYHDSIDSAYFAEQTRIEDSIKRVDSIENFSCPEVDVYIHMSERAIAILEEPGHVPGRADRYGKVADSTGIYFNELIQQKFTSMDPICRKRLMAMSLVYLNRQANAVNDLDPVTRQLFQHTAKDLRTDSLAKAIQFGE